MDLTAQPPVSRSVPSFPHPVSATSPPLETNRVSDIELPKIGCYFIRSFFYRRFHDARLVSHPEVRDLPLRLSHDWVRCLVFASFAGAPAADAAELKVVTTIKPIHSLVEGVMEGVGKPTLLVTGAASPHTIH